MAETAISSYFSLCDHNWIGFDMDHTLIRYKLANLESLIFKCAMNYLVHFRGYPARLLDIKYEMGKFIKGIFYDKYLGNFFKVDINRRVISAFHGTHRFTPEQIKEIYPNPIEFHGVTNERYWCATSYFEIPFFAVAACLVDLIDEQLRSENKLPHDSTDFTRYNAVNQDIFRAIVHNYGDWNSGWFFPELRERTSEYIDKREAVKKWLINLRNNGVKLFLLTNSGHEYSECLMSYAYGSDWRSLFDLIVYKARKPYFYLFENAFLELPSQNEPTLKSEPNKEYLGGNARDFINNFLKSNKVCYFGDDLIADVVTPSHYFKWSTVAIVEELEALERESGKDYNDNLNSDCFHHTEQWGSYFYTDDGELTYWGYAIQRFASLYIPCISRLSLFPVDSKFERRQQTNADTIIASALLTPKRNVEAEWLVPTKESLELATKVLHSLEDKTDNKNRVRRLSVDRS